jgi:hypothetical protein
VDPGRIQIRHLTVSLCLLLAVAGCDDIVRHNVGDSGQSFTAGDEFVILNNGYRRGDVTWIVARSWPASSTPAQRLADGRLVRGLHGEFRVRHPGGELASLAASSAHIFSGDRLTIFALRMREDDLMSWRPQQLRSYAEVEAFLRRYERRDGSP